jgi:hypothetical protein
VSDAHSSVVQGRCAIASTKMDFGGMTSHGA